MSTASVRPMVRCAILAGFVLGASLAGPVFAQSVPGSSNPYLAGMPNGSTCCGGDAAPAQSPVQAAIAVTPGSSLTFSASGSVSFDGANFNGPDGGGIFGTTGSNGISGATWPINALVGVFLDNSQPDGTPAPADLDFSTGSGIAFTTLSPALKQAFFIGDGRTGTGSGAVQTFVVPAGATRLFLGTTDGFGWFNNTGSFSVTVGGAVPPPVAATIPVLSPALLAVLAVALFGFAARALRRR